MELYVFFIAIGAPFLWAFVNQSDKYLVNRFSGSQTSGGIGGIMIVSTISSIILLPFIILRDPNVFNITILGAIILIFTGVLSAISVLLYLYALTEDEASAVVPFMQLVPIFSFISGYYLLGETINSSQIIGGLIIILGASFLSVGGIYRGQKLHFKKRVVILMTLHSISFALYGTLFKFVSIQQGFWSGVFWEAIGLVTTGIVLLFIPSYQRGFRAILNNSKIVVSLTLFNQLLTILANWLMAFASLLTKIVLVTLIAGFQPAFVLIFGVFTTIFFPKFVKEDISKESLFQKVVAISIIVLGTYLLY